MADPLATSIGNLDQTSNELDKLIKVLKRMDVNENREEALRDIRKKASEIVGHVDLAFEAMGMFMSVPEARPEDAEVATRNIPLPEGTAFSDFLAQIGESVIQTQERLDERSIEYLDSIRNRPYIPPTMFRIPKISAELKVALQKSTATGLNVILFSHKTEMSELNQQSMNFEIAAVPPSPELLQRLHDQTPRIDFLFDMRKRGAILEKAQSLIGNQSNPNIKKELEKMVKPESKNKVLIWPVKDTNSVLLLFAGETSGEVINVYFLDPDKDALFPVIRDLTPKPGEDRGPLRQFVFQLGLDQSKLLDAL